MSKIQVNDITMYYEVHGKGEPIVFIGGFSSESLVWGEIIDKFKDHYQVIVFDNRGAGQTDAPCGPYSIAKMAKDTATLCSHLGIVNAHFVGNSMGGFIVQTLAFKYPHLVKSAVISNSASTAHTCFSIHLAAQLDLLKGGAPLATLTKAASSWAFSFQFLSKPGMLDQLIQLNLNNPHPFTVAGYEGQFAALNQFDSSTWISKINVPVLVLASSHDLIFNQQSVKLLAEKIPTAKYYCFSECGHLPQIEQPEKFYKIVLEFIRTIPFTESMAT